MNCRRDDLRRVLESMVIEGEVPAPDVLEESAKEKVPLCGAVAASVVFAMPTTLATIAQEFACDENGGGEWSSMLSVELPSVPTVDRGKRLLDWLIENGLEEDVAKIIDRYAQLSPDEAKVLAQTVCVHRCP